MVNVDLCTVPRNCSSTGIECAASDTLCQSRATTDHLEIVCTTEDSAAFVYCPVGTRHAESNAVWILLAFAGALAIGGAVFLFRMIRTSS